MFINSELLEEIPFSRPTEGAVRQLPEEDKMYVGCRRLDFELKDFGDMEMDELAFWISYLPDDKIIEFTGAICELHYSW